MNFTHSTLSPQYSSKIYQSTGPQIKTSKQTKQPNPHNTKTTQVTIQNNHKINPQKITTKKPHHNQQSKLNHNPKPINSP
jgi:hypothetical protein